MPIHRAGRQVEGGGNLGNGHANEVTHLVHRGSLGIFERQGREGLIDGQQFPGGFRITLLNGDAFYKRTR
jgi:hypothetical protein